MKQIGFDNRQQCNNTQKKERARKIKVVDERIDALKLSTLLAQVKDNLTLTVNIGKQSDKCF